MGFKPQYLGPVVVWVTLQENGKLKIYKSPWKPEAQDIACTRVVLLPGTFDNVAGVA